MTKVYRLDITPVTKKRAKIEEIQTNLKPRSLTDLSCCIQWSLKALPIMVKTKGIKLIDHLKVKTVLGPCRILLLGNLIKRTCREIKIRIGRKAFNVTILTRTSNNKTRFKLRVTEVCLVSCKIIVITIKINRTTLSYAKVPQPQHRYSDP